MFDTTEIRWFLKGRIPFKVGEWFENCPGEWHAQPQRTDYYYRLREGKSLGIKIRQGRIELKERTSSPEIVHIQRNVIGVIEDWRKWGLELSEELDVENWQHFSGRSWLPVKKSRRLRMYGLASDSTLISQEFIQGSVCQVELTSVFVQNSMWWSLGLESSGVQANRKETFLDVANELLRNVEGFRLLKDDSMSYPEWLRAIPH